MHAAKNISQDYPIVLYDGECNLCNSSIQFILNNEKNNQLRFSPLSDAEIKFPNLQFPDSSLTDAIHFLHKDKVLIESDAIIAISDYLKWPYSWIQYTEFIPKAIRDSIYRFIAQRRLSIQSLFNQTCDLNQEYPERMI